jgi:hypothetical protein
MDDLDLSRRLGEVRFAPCFSQGHVTASIRDRCRRPSLSGTMDLARSPVCSKFLERTSPGAVPEGSLTQPLAQRPSSP